MPALQAIPVGTGPSAARYSLGPSPHEKMGLGLYSKAVACYYPLPKNICEELLAVGCWLTIKYKYFFNSIGKRDL